MQKTAIILGATGLTGSHLLNQLLRNKNYSSIKLFSRSTCGIKNPKIEEHLGNLFDLEHFKNDFFADEVYVCIGTTKRKTPNRETYRKIDIGIPAEAATLASENGITKIAVISAIGADSNSSITYNKIKGEMEEKVKAANIDQTFILQPSMILGDRDEKRTGEKVGLAIFKLFSFLLIGPLKKYRAVKAADIAKKMIELCNSNAPSQIIASNKI